MLRTKPTMISLSIKDVTEHLENIDRKAATARATGTVNSSSMRQPLGALRNESTPAMAEEPRVIYLNERDTRIQGITAITPVPISTDMLHSFDLTIRSRSSAEGGATATGLRSFQSLLQDDAENRTQITQDDDSVSLGFLESDRDDTEGPEFIEEDQDSMMTEVPGASPIPRAPRPSLDYRDSSFEGSPRDSSSFVPEDASTPPAPLLNTAHNRNLERLRARHHPLARSPVFRSIDPSQTPRRPTTVGLAPRLQSPGTPSTLFSQPPIRSARSYRQREMTYSYEDSENPNAEEVEIWEDDTAGPPPIDDDDYFEEEADDYYHEEEEEDEGIEDAQEDEGNSDAVDPRLEEAAATHAEQAAATHLHIMLSRQDSLRYGEHSSIHDSETTEDVDEALPSSPPMYVGQAGGVDRNMSRSSRTLVQNLQSAATSAATSVRTVSGLPSSPSLMLPPPFSASPRKVSDNKALPASPATARSSDDDRGDRRRGRTRFPRLDQARPSSMDAQVGDSPASPASPFDYSNLSLEDGSPSSDANSNRTNVTALPIRGTGPPSTDGTTQGHNRRPDSPRSYYQTAGGRPRHLTQATGVEHTDDTTSAASLYHSRSSRSPFPSYSARITRPSPERTQSAIVPRPLPPLPIRNQEMASMPPPPGPGARESSPSRDRLWRSNTSPSRPIRQPVGPPGTMPSGEWFSSSTSRNTTSHSDRGDQVDGSTSPQTSTRPSTSRGGPPSGRTPFPNLSGSAGTTIVAPTPRPLPPVPTPFVPPVPPGSLTPSAPASALRAYTTTPGTSRPERRHDASRAPPNLPMRLPRTPGRNTPGPGGTTLTGARTPGGTRIRVYNDARAAEVQPQTPEDLPEARHRSRHHPNYTAPLRQDNTPRDYRDRNGGRDGMNSEMRIRRGRGTRSDSPLGVRGGGSHSPLGLRGGGTEGFVWRP